MKKQPKILLGDGQNPEEGKWIRPVSRGYKFECCDCGLVHRLDFDHIPFGNGRKVIMRAWRDEQATRRARKSEERRKQAHNSRYATAISDDIISRYKKHVDPSLRCVDYLREAVIASIAKRNCA